MKNESQDTSLAKVILAANLYYKNHFSQQEIAKIMHISRPWVSKLLTRAQELGVYEVHVNTSIHENRNLSDQLRIKYGLDYACVVVPDKDSSDRVAAAAANYFLSKLQADSNVCVAWGQSLARVLANMLAISMPDVNIYPMAGSFGTTIETMPNYSAIQLAKKLGATSYPLHSPAVCATIREYEAMRSHPRFAEVLDKSEHSNIILASIGMCDDSLADRTGIFSDEDVESLTKAGAIADMALNFFDAEGCKVETELTRRTICTDIRKASEQADSVIVYAEGKHKVPAIRAALKGHWMTALITSEETAAELVKDSQVGDNFA